MVEQQNFNKWKDAWFYYKIIAAFVILGGFLTVYLYHMITKTYIRGIDYPFSYWIFQDQILSFFTYQTNLMIGIWFSIAAVYHNRKNRFIDSPSIRLAITTYISITAIVYTLILFPNIVTSQNVKTEALVTGPYFHMLTPLLMLIYSFTHLQPFTLTAKQYYRKNFWFYWIYPWVYTIYLIIRVILYFHFGHDVPFGIIFPYAPLMEVFDISSAIFASVQLVLVMFLFFLVAHILLIMFNYIYFLIFKKFSSKSVAKSKKTT